jgi:hypothetical protein
VETTAENKDGFFSINGYKKVNAITMIKTSDNHMNTDVKALEDFYDIEGNYLKTVVLHSTFNKSKVTLSEEGEESTKELQEPSTILIPVDKRGGFVLNQMTEEEKKNIKEHVLYYVEQLNGD